MTKTKNIFLAEDDEDDQQFFIEAVKEIDNFICIYVANNGVEALAKLNNMLVLPDLIFMDINMPLMNGFECLTQLKRKIRFKNIPVVILTTSNNRSEKELAKVLGANFFLSKVSDFSLFIRNITDMLNLNFSPFMSTQKMYEHINISSLPAGMEPLIISSLERN
jgi:CheY-like chemotaxis protein